MHAASRLQSNDAALRSHLLSNDIGNIDINVELNIKQQKQPVQQPVHHQQQYPPPQHHPQQYPYAHYHNPPPQNVRYNDIGGISQNQPIPRIPVAPQPRSRRSSIVSDHSNFNSFLKFGKQKKSYTNGDKGDDDDDDDEKDVIMDSTQSRMMSFDDISTIKDRGRYGGQSTYDTAPIIPTLVTPASNPRSGLSGVQYRKQMTAIKKQAYSNAGKIISSGDPRTMSLQSNPYGSETPVYLSSPRSNSLAGGPHPQQLQPRVNSFQQPAPRAQSLTASVSPQFQQRGPPGPYGGYPPNMRHQGPANMKRYSGSGPSPLGQQSYSQQHNLQVQTRQRYQPTQQPHNPQVHPQVLPPAPPQQQHYHHIAQQVQYQHQQQQPFRSQYDLESQHPNTQNQRQGGMSDADQDIDTSHHYLADNTQDNENLDRSGLSFSDNSTQMHPKDESTPSPGAVKNNIVNLEDEAESPSKLPRSKGLPHLSLLKLRDDDEEEEEEGRDNKDLVLDNNLSRKSPSKDIEFTPRVLEPLDESKAFESNRLNNNTPPLQGTPKKSYVSPARNQPPIYSGGSSPQRRLKSDKNHFRNSVSISSMSEYSTVSDNPEYVNDNNQELYKLAHKSSTANDIFVTASQFTLQDNPETPIAETISDADETPILKSQSSEYDHEIESQRSDSFKEAFKSPKFFKRWSRKKGADKYETQLPAELVSSSTDEVPKSKGESSSFIDDSPPASTPPSSAKGDLDDDEDTLEYQKNSLAGSFVPKQATKTLNLTVDQLGIMEDKTTLVRELDLVSRELAASIKRELMLEQRLNGNAIKSPIFDTDIQLRECALKISQLTQSLNEERKKRYIAEEHVLLQENGIQPSPLELNYENERLKAEIANKEEIINKQTAEIEQLRADLPVMEDKLKSLMDSNRELEETNSKLRNEVELYQNDHKRLTILTQKFRMLQNEKHTEKATSLKTPIKSNDQSSVSQSNLMSPASIKNQRAFVTGSPNASLDDIKTVNGFNPKLATFSLINVSNSADD